MNEREKIEAMITLGDVLGDFLLEKLPNGIERNQVFIAKECKEISKRMGVILQRFGRECGDPAKVEKALSLTQAIHSTVDEFLSENDSSKKEDESNDDSVKRLIERLFSD